MPSPPIDVYSQQTSLSDPFRRITPHLDVQAAGEPALGIEQVARTAETLANRKAHADAATQAANTATDLRIETMKGFQAAKENAAPDAAGFTDAMLADFDKTTKTIATAHADNPLVGQYLQPHINQLREHLAQSSIDFEARQRVAYRADSAIQNANKAAAVVEADPTQITEAGAPIIQQINQAGFEPETRLKLMRAVDDTLSLAGARGLANSNPRAVLDQLAHPEQAGQIIAGLTPQQREVIQGHAQQKLVQQTGDGIVNVYRQIGPSAGAQAFASIDKSDLPDFLKDQVRQHVLAGINQWQGEARQANQAQIIKLEEGLNSGQPPPDARQQIYSLHNRGVYGPEETATKLAQADRAELARAGDDASIAWADQAYKGDVDHPNGRPLDAENGDVKKAIDGLFNHYAGQLQAGSPEWVSRAADIAHRTGVAPDSAVSWSRAQLISGDPKLAATGADMLARLQEAAPRGAPFAVDTKTEALARQVVDFVRGGVDPVTAVNLARKNTAIGEPERKFLEAKWQQKVPEKNFESMAANAVVAQLKDDPRFKPGMFSSVPTPSRELATEYGNLVHDYFLYTDGNLEQSQQLAAAAVRRTWGVTEVNGKREIMPYAPEAMFPGLTADQVRADIAKLSGELPGVDVSKIRLTPTAQTARSGGLLWSLTAPNQYGAYDVVTGKNGNPRTYHLPVTAQDQQNELDAARAKAFGTARAMQQQRIESERLQQQALDAEMKQSQAPGSLRYR